MAMSHREDQFERRARDLYRRASTDTAPSVAGQLRAARRVAMATPATSVASRLLLPAGAFAVLALAAIMVWPSGQRSVPMPMPAMAVATEVDNDLPPDADSADPSMVEHLEFYSWLAADTGQGHR
jgi:hypothetical protein